MHLAASNLSRGPARESRNSRQARFIVNVFRELYWSEIFCKDSDLIHIIAKIRDLYQKLDCFLIFLFVVDFKQRSFLNNDIAMTAGYLEHSRSDDLQF